MMAYYTKQAFLLGLQHIPFRPAGLRWAVLLWYLFFGALAKHTAGASQHTRNSREQQKGGILGLVHMYFEVLNRAEEEYFERTII